MNRSAFIAATLIAVLGCSPKTETAFENGRSLDFDWWCKGGKKESKILYEIKTLPKVAFLEAVATATALTKDEKTTISNNISPDVYTHANVQKAEYRNTRFMVIDQFYPMRVVGKDSDGREIVEGGSGFLKLIVLSNSNGVQSSVVHYD